MLHVPTRLFPFLPCALASADGIRPFPFIAPAVNVPRRTRRKPSTISSAAPDVVIGQSTAARAGARPYRPANWLGPIAATVCSTNDSTLTEAKAFVSGKPSQGTGNLLKGRVGKPSEGLLKGKPS